MPTLDTRNLELVWLASWPRSGNTWLRIILHQAFGLKSVSMYQDEEQLYPDPLYNVVGHIKDQDELDEAAKTQTILPVKTHDVPSTKVRPDHKGIYIVRDGREVCVSACKYVNWRTGENRSVSEFIEGNGRFGSWSDHLRAWHPRSRPNTLLLWYECMVGDNVGKIIDALAAFLDIEPVRRDMPSFAELKAMQPDFFRSGTNGTWRHEMTDKDKRRFDELHGDTMREYGYTLADVIGANTE